MARRLKGITVTLISKIQTGTDPFGAPTFETQEVPVENVLISPISSEDMANQLNITGHKAVYTLAIPKGDQHDWTGQEVRFFGERWRVVGEPLQGIEDLIPLDWNKKIQVERYE